MEEEIDDDDDEEEEEEEEMLDFHNPELQKAVIRVEEMMRDMVESGVEPDLHSFMAGAVYSHTCTHVCARLNA